MAKIGLKYLAYKTPTTAGLVGKGVSADIAITVNDVVLMADDAIAESDKSFQTGTYTLGTDNMTTAVEGDLLGHTVDGDGMLIANENDIAPYVETGFYAQKIVNGARFWRALWLLKVKFGEPSDSNVTKAQTPTFGTHSIVGTVMLNDDGNWKKERTFDREADAKAFIDTLAGITVTPSAGLSALALTGTGGTLSPSFDAGVRYYTFGGLTGTSFTVTATAASHTIKMYVDGAYVATLTSGTPSAAVAMATVGTKKVTIVAYENQKPSQTTEIVVVKTA